MTLLLDAPRLGDLATGRDNNLNLIRFLAAGAVLVSHAWPIALGPEARQPLEAQLGITLGHLAVSIFFVASGFLIARSWTRAQDFKAWAAARVLRLFPALLVTLALTAFVLGPAVTALSPAAYWTAPGTWTYVPANLSLAFLQYPLPGVFETNPYPQAINGSLWTLVHEVACYGGVALAGALGLLAGPRRFALCLLGFLAFQAAVRGGGEALPLKLRLLADLSVPFFLGMAAQVLAPRLRLHWAAALLLWGLALSLRGLPGGREALMLAIAYSVFWIAYVPAGPLRLWNRLGDYSYGVYIWAFPMQQFAVALWGPMTPLQNIALSAPPTLLLALLSWVAVERRALGARHALADRLRRLARRASAAG